MAKGDQFRPILKPYYEIWKKRQAGVSTTSGKKKKSKRDADDEPPGEAEEEAERPLEPPDD